jgi:hypothetical protein
MEPMMDRSRFGPARVAVLVLLALAPPACGGDPDSSAVSAVRDTLPGGAERVRYGPLPVSDPDPLAEDLRIGVLEGDPVYQFGSVRGLAVGADGRIFVLDGQAGAQVPAVVGGQCIGHHHPAAGPHRVQVRARGEGRIQVRIHHILRQGLAVQP